MEVSQWLDEMEATIHDGLLAFLNSANSRRAGDLPGGVRECPNRIIIDFLFGNVYRFLRHLKIAKQECSRTARRSLANPPID